MRWDRCSLGEAHHGQHTRRAARGARRLERDDPVEMRIDRDVEPLADVFHLVGHHIDHERVAPIDVAHVGAVRVVRGARRAFDGEIHVAGEGRVQMVDRAADDDVSGSRGEESHEEEDSALHSTGVADEVHAGMH